MVCTRVGKSGFFFPLALKVIEEIMARPHLGLGIIFIRRAEGNRREL